MRWNAGYPIGHLPDRDLNPPDVEYYCENCGLQTDEPASDRNYDVLCPDCWDRLHPDAISQKTKTKC